MPAGVGNNMSVLSAPQLGLLGLAVDFRWQLQPVAQQMVTVWSGGQSRQLAIAPSGSTLAGRDFRWRLSSATVQQDGAFSDFSGYQRWLTLCTGTDLQLRIDQQQMTLRRPGFVACFAGAAKTAGYLGAGPVQDLNLIVAADLHAGLQLISVSILQAAELAVAGQHRLWLVIAAQPCWVHFQQQTQLLTAGDVLILHGDFRLSASPGKAQLTASSAQSFPQPDPQRPAVWLGWVQPSINA